MEVTNTDKNNDIRLIFAREKKLKNKMLKIPVFTVFIFIKKSYTKP